MLADGLDSDIILLGCKSFSDDWPDKYSSREADVMRKCGGHQTNWWSKTDKLDSGPESGAS